MSGLVTEENPVDLGTFVGGSSLQSCYRPGKRHAVGVNALLRFDHC
jgi:hypothetical protein